MGHVIWTQAVNSYACKNEGYLDPPLERRRLNFNGGKSLMDPLVQASLLDVGAQARPKAAPLAVADEVVWHHAGAAREGEL